MTYHVINNASTGVIYSINAVPTAAGLNYQVGDVLTITTGGGDATVTVGTIGAGGDVTGISLTTGGTGYSNGTGQATSGGNGTGCTVEITAITVTSNKHDIRGARKVTMICKRSSHAAGTSIHSATIDSGDDGVTYNRFLTNATNANNQTEARVASLTLSADGSDFLSMECPNQEFITPAVRLTTDGVADVWITTVI